jgi:hypothetical protein
MIPIGILCYSSPFLNREDLKQAIQSHPSWQVDPTEHPPIFDIYLGDFLSSGKKTKMLFVSGEKSKQDDLILQFKTLYDGSQKAYPNGSLMLFIPLTDGTLTLNIYREKIFFNHERKVGDETVVSIGGLQDLKTLIRIKGSSQEITIRTLLKSLPASPGMTTAQLLIHAEANHADIVTMGVYNRADHSHILARQSTLEQELRSIIEPGEEAKIFQDLNDGIWFAGGFHQRNGRIITSRHPSKQELDNATRINKILQSPPKKRGGGLMPSGIQFPFPANKLSRSLTNSDAPAGPSSSKYPKCSTLNDNSNPGRVQQT